MWWAFACTNDLALREAPFAAGGQLVIARAPDSPTVIVVEDDRHPVVALQIWLRVGSADETPGATGVAHLLEHVAFRRPDHRAWDDVVNGLGGVAANAWTWQDATAFASLVPPEAIPALLRAEAERLTTPPTEADLALERDVVANELGQLSADPTLATTAALWSTAFAGHPYAVPIGGRDLPSLDVDDAEAFGAQRGREAVAVVLVGDVVASEVIPLVAEAFRDLPASSARPSRPSPTHREARSTLKIPGLHPRVHLGFPAPTLADPDVPALQVLDLALGSGQSAPIPRALEDAGLAADATSRLSPLRSAGLWEWRMAVLPGVPLEQAEGTLRDALAGGATDADLERGRAAWVGAIWSQVVDHAGIAAWLGWHEVIAGDAKIGADRLQSTAPSIDTVRLAQARWPLRDAATAVGLATMTDPSPRLPLIPPALTLPLPTPTARHGARLTAPTTWNVAGIAVDIEPDPDTPLVWLRVGFPTGSAADAIGGEANLAARAWLRGGADLPRADLEGGLEALGASASVEVDAEATWLLLRCPAASLRPSLELLARSWRSTPSPAELRQLVAEVRNRIGGSQDLGAVAALSHLRQRHGRDHPYARPVTGTQSTLRQLSPRAVTDAGQSILQSAPIAALAGAVDGDMQADLAHLFDALPTPGPRHPAPAEVPLPGQLPILLLDRVDAPFAVVRLGRATLAVDDPRLPASLLADEALAGGPSGVLSRVLRGERGLAYQVTIDRAFRRSDRGTWAVVWTTPPAHVRETVDLIRDALTTAMTSLPADDLSRARRVLGDGIRYATDTAPERAGLRAVERLTGWDDVDLRRQAAGSSDAAAADALAATLDGPLFLIVAGSASQILEQLEPLGEVRVLPAAVALER